jgi:hypothetical protein
MLGTLGSETAATFSYNSLMPPVPFVVRGAVAFGLVVWGARKNRPFVLPLVVALAQPDWQPWAFGLLAAVPRLMQTPTEPAGPTESIFAKFGRRLQTSR